MCAQIVAKKPSSPQPIQSAMLRSSNALSATVGIVPSISRKPQNPARNTRMLKSIRILILLLLLSSAGCGVLEKRVVPASPSFPNGLMTTNYVVSPKVSSFLNTVGEVNNALPTPYQGPVNGLLGLVSGVLGWIAYRKNRQADAASSVVRAVESLPASTSIKQVIQARAIRDGTEPVLNQIVRENT